MGIMAEVVNTDRQRFEALHAQLGPVTGIGFEPPVNDAGTIAWGTSWVLRGYLLMFEATGDPDYLKRLVEAAEWILRARDCERGVRDYRGQSAPAWSSTGAFTVATATVPDTQGRTALLVRVCPPGSAATYVDVQPGTAAGRVTLTVSGAAGARDVLADLALDRDDPRFAPRVAYDAYPGRTRTTIEVPSAQWSGTARPVAGRYACMPARVTLAAQTGMITHPIAALVRVVREQAELVGQGLRERAEQLLEPVAAALAVHDGQWQVDGLGRGFYVWAREEPVSFAGVELPTNEFLAMGRAHAEVAAVTSDGSHRERAHAIAETLRSQLRLRRGLCTWSYWPDFGHVHRGWSKTGSPTTDVSPFRPQFGAQPKLEDVTHALVDTEFACAYHRADWLPAVLRDADLSAMAATYLRSVALQGRFGGRRTVTPVIRRDVSGRGTLAPPAQQFQACGWLPLTTWQPGVRQHVRRLVVGLEGGDPDRGPVPAGTPVRGVDAYCAALLARWG